MSHILRKPWSNYRNSVELLHLVNLKLKERNLRIKIPFSLMNSNLILRTVKEPFTLNWICENLKEGETFMDVGANIGEFSLIAKKISGNSGKLISLEPRKKTFRKIRLLMQVNGISSNLFLFRYAASDHNGTSYLRGNKKLAPAFGKSKVAVKPQNNWTLSGYMKYEKINVIKIDDLIIRNDLPIPNLIKIDVEGHEIEVLGGMRSLLENKELRGLLIETTIEKGEIAVDILEQFLFNDKHWLRLPNKKSPGYLAFKR